MKKIDENWFKDWFNSDHYHLLYQHRDEKEAEQFIAKLFDYLNLSPSAKILDLACGKGRHAIQVRELGFSVLGLDLSEESIKVAQQSSEEKLEFEIGDMRSIGHYKEFDLVLNLFTSFGYFKKEEENVKVIESIAQSLKDDGLLVLDYLNVAKAQKNIPIKESIKRGEVTFQIEKYIEEGFIVKDIFYRHKGQERNHQELVKLIDRTKFEAFLKRANLKLLTIFGDYLLNEFDEENSERLILLAQKITE